MTYHFYFFVWKFPKFFNFSDSMEKIYLVELNIFKENAIYGLQKILLDNFSRNFYIWSAIVNGACMQKIKIGHRTKFQATFNFRCADFPWLPHVIDLENSHYFLTQSDSKFGGVPSQLLVNTHQQMMVFWVVSF